MSIPLPVTTVNKIVNILEILLASARNIRTDNVKKRAVLGFDKSYFKRNFRIARSIYRHYVPDGAGISFRNLRSDLTRVRPAQPVETCRKPKGPALGTSTGLICVNCANLNNRKRLGTSMFGSSAHSRNTWSRIPAIQF